MSSKTRRVVRVYLTEEEYAGVTQFCLDVGLDGLTVESVAKQALLSFVQHAYQQAEQLRDERRDHEADKALAGVGFVYHSR